jgi:hypothetical protein
MRTSQILVAVTSPHYRKIPDEYGKRDRLLGDCENNNGTRKWREKNIYEYSTSSGSGESVLKPKRQIQIDVNFHTYVPTLPACLSQLQATYFFKSSYHQFYTAVQLIRP